MILCCQGYGKCILQGWPDLVEEEFQPYYQKRTELTIQDGCILGASRVVVPTVGCLKALEELHQGHPGVFPMRALARSIVWWPELDARIEDKVKSCSDCQSNQKRPDAAPLHPWGYPTCLLIIEALHITLSQIPLQLAGLKN